MASRLLRFACCRLLSLFLRCNPRLLAFASWLMLLSLLLLLLLFWLGVRWRCVFVFGAGSAAVVVLVLVAYALGGCACALRLYVLFAFSSLLALLLAPVVVLALCWPCAANACPLLPLRGLPWGAGRFRFWFARWLLFTPSRFVSLDLACPAALLPCFGPGSPSVCSSALPLGFVAVLRLAALLLFFCGVGRVPLPSTSRRALRSALRLCLRCVAVVSGFCFAALLAVRFAVLPAWSGASGGLGLPSALVCCHWPAWLWRLPGFCFGGSGLWSCFPGRCALGVVLLVLLGFRRLVLCRPVWLLRGPGFAPGLPIPAFSASALLALPCLAGWCRCLTLCPVGASFPSVCGVDSLGHSPSALGLPSGSVASSALRWAAVASVSLQPRFVCIPVWFPCFRFLCGCFYFFLPPALPPWRSGCACASLAFAFALLVVLARVALLLTLRFGSVALARLAWPWLRSLCVASNGRPHRFAAGGGFTSSFSLFFCFPGGHSVSTFASHLLVRGCL